MTKTADKLAEALRLLLDLSMVPLTDETMCTDQSVAAWSAGHEALAEWESGKAQPSVPANVMQDMIDIGTGKLKHDYQGLCPDALEGHDLRDPACRACRALSLAAPTSPQAAEQAGEAVAKIVSSGPANFPIMQWLSADHSFRAPIGSLLYAGSPPKSIGPIGFVPVPVDALKEAIESIDDYRAGVEFGSSDRKLLGRLNALLGQESQASHPPVQPQGGA